MPLPPTVLIVVDTLRYEEPLQWSWLRDVPHRWHTRHYGTAPYTLAAMATIVSGKLPQDHGLYYWKLDPPAIMARSDVQDTVAEDFDNAFAMTGAGWAHGPTWGFARGFDWHRTPDKDARLRGKFVSDANHFTLLHTYELHHYVFDVDPDRTRNIHDEMEADEAHPIHLTTARNRRLVLVGERIKQIVEANPYHRILVTSDHGEGFSWPRGFGHGFDKWPTDEILHLPLIEFGPAIHATHLDHSFIPQNRLRSHLAGVPPVDDPANVYWPAENVQESISFRLQPNGVTHAVVVGEEFPMFGQISQPSDAPCA